MGVHTPHLDIGNGPPRRGGDDVRRIATAAHGHDATGLGQAIRREDGLGTDAVPELDDEFHRHDGGTGHDESQRPHDGNGIGTSEQGLEERRRPRQHRDGFGLEVSTHNLEVEHWFWVDGGPSHETGQESRLVAKGVEEGIDDQVAVAVTESHDRGPGAEGPERLRVTGRDALRVPGCPRGEDEVRRRVRVHCGAPSLVLLFCHRAATGQQHVEGRHRRSLGQRGRRALHRHDRRQPAEILPDQHRRVVESEEPFDRAEGADLGRAEDVGRFCALEPGVERDDHATN